MYHSKSQRFKFEVVCGVYDYDLLVKLRELLHNVDRRDITHQSKYETVDFCRSYPRFFAYRLARNRGPDPRNPQKMGSQTPQIRGPRTPGPGGLRDPGPDPPKLGVWPGTPNFKNSEGPEKIGPITDFRGSKRSIKCVLRNARFLKGFTKVGENGHFWPFSGSPDPGSRTPQKWGFPGPGIGVPRAPPLRGGWEGSTSSTESPYLV